MKNHYQGLLLASLTASFLVACGGGGSSAPPMPTSHIVNLSWTANKETAVNSIGGGYQVAIPGKATINVPFPYGASGPSATVTLMTGSYTATVTAYSAMNPLTGLAAPGVTSSSLPSASLAINVPY